MTMLQKKGAKMKSKEVIRRIVANIYWSLKRDYKDMELQDIYYDVGLAVGYCQAIDRADISHKIYNNIIKNISKSIF